MEEIQTLEHPIVMEPIENLKGVIVIEEAPEPEDIDIVDEIPIERKQLLSETLIAEFKTVTDLENQYKHGNFNTLGRKVPRDETRETNTTQKVINAVNHYSYNASAPEYGTGLFLNVLTLSGRYWFKRRYIREGYYGHYRSSGRDMFVGPGYHSLVSTVESWINHENNLPEVPIDDEENLTRTFGSKILIYVPENHIGGAYRVGLEDELAEDGEFVIFPQGHHVLPNENYRDVQIVELVPNDPINFGPMTILFIKEGYIGGAYSKTDGRYAIFSPGPPYIFNKKDFYDSVIVKRTTGKFKIGPVTFLTIQKGCLGSATHKTGKTQYLYPGKTYQLHEKDFSNIECVRRTLNFELGSCYFVTVQEGFLACSRNKRTGNYQLFDHGHTYQLSKELYDVPELKEYTLNFKIGPYHFLTVEEGYMAGALNKKKGEFELFKSGETYKLHTSTYESPIIKKIDSYMVTCGHYTQITPRDDMLIGAFKYGRNGEKAEFVQFDEPTIIHSYRDYYGLESINKYSDNPQTFGPYKIVTVPSGQAGIFNCQGKLEVKEPGWYKLSAEYNFMEFVPLKTFPTKIDVDFTTKDGVIMKVTLTVVWSVNDAHQVSLYPGGLTEIRKEIINQSQLVVSRICRNYNRDQILPTKQDVLLRIGSSVDVDEEKIKAMLKENDKETEELYKTLQDTFSKSLENSLSSSRTGSAIVSARLENFLLMDEGIKENLHKITQAIVDTSRQKVEADKELKHLQNQAKLSEEREKASATVAIEKARADARVKEEQERAIASVAIEKAKAQAEVKKQESLANVQVEKERAVAHAEIEREQAKIYLEKTKAETEAKSLSAKTEAEGIRVKAEAEAESIRMKLNAEAEGKRKAIEAESFMSEKQLQIELAKLEVEMARGYGEAAWKNPDKLERLFEHFKGRITMGNVDLGEMVLRERMDEHDKPKSSRQPINSSALRAAGLSSLKQ